MSERVAGVDDLLRGEDEIGGEAVGDGPSAQRLKGEQVLHEPEEKAAEQRRLAGRIQRQEDDDEQNEIRPCAFHLDEAGEGDLQAQGEVGEDEVGEPFHFFSC